jgi:hypothetical protein
MLRDNAQESGLFNSLTTVLNVKFAKDIGSVPFDCIVGNAKLFCNFLIPQAQGKQFQNFLFAICQRI